MIGTFYLFYTLDFHKRFLLFWGVGGGWGEESAVGRETTVKKETLFSVIYKISFQERVQTFKEPLKHYLPSPQA